MKKLLLFILFAPLLAFGQTTVYTEFYCNGTGDNLNSGTTTNAVATSTWTGGTFRTNDAVFTTAGEDPGTNALVVGYSFASIYTTAGAVTSYYVAVITATNSTSVTLSLTAKAGGVALISTNAGETTCKIGGAWRGPNGTVAFPFVLTNTAWLTNAVGNPFRCNIQSGYSNSTSALITDVNAGPRTFQGYTSVAGDGGKAIFDGGGGAFGLLKTSGVGNVFRDIIFQNYGSAAASYGLELGGSGSQAIGCVGRNGSGPGFRISSYGCMLVECEAYHCCLNAATLGGFSASGSSPLVLRCLSHDNNAWGFTGGGYYVNCIAASNNFSGFMHNESIAGGTVPVFIGCDSVSNKQHGVELKYNNTTLEYIENCNLLANGNFGLFNSNGYPRICSLVSNWFGSGTQTNALGNCSPNFGFPFDASVNLYGADTVPYVSARNWSLNPSALSYGQGRGNFTDLLYSGGTAGRPSVGAAVGTNSSGTITNTVGGGEHSHTFIQ